MSVRIRLTLDVDQIPAGSGMATLGQDQSNDPGYGGTLTAGPVGNAQTLELMVAEIVPGGDTPSSANFLTALQSAATDLQTRLNTAGAYSGGTQTPLQIIDGWITGTP